MASDVSDIWLCTGGHVPTVKEVNVEIKLFKEQVKYARWMQRGFVKDVTAASSSRNISFLWVTADVNRSRRLWVAKVVPLFRLSIVGNTVDRK